MESILEDRSGVSGLGSGLKASRGLFHRRILNPFILFWIDSGGLIELEY
jgi:hypothetical protein